MGGDDGGAENGTGMTANSTVGTTGLTPGAKYKYGPQK